MIELLPIESNRVVGMRIDGKIAKEDIQSVVDAAEAKLASGGPLAVYVELESFGTMSIDALLADLKFAFRHFRDFDKKAVVTDKKWTKPLAKLGVLFPHVEVRQYAPEQKEEALAWLEIPLKEKSA